MKRHAVFRGRIPRILDPEATKLPISDYSSTIPALSLHHPLKLEPVVGLEPTTDGLQNRCSTTELNWRRYLNHQPRLKVPTVREVPDSICALVFGSFVARKRAVLFSTERDTFCEGPTRWQVNSPPL